MNQREETFRTINKMVEFFTNLYDETDIPYDIQGRPSVLDYTNMTIISGKHSYYVGASKDKLLVYELGIKTFPQQSVALEDITNMEYTENYIKFNYKGKTLYIDLINSERTYLNEGDENN